MTFVVDPGEIIGSRGFGVNARRAGGNAGRDRLGNLSHDQVFPGSRQVRPGGRGKVERSATCPGSASAVPRGEEGRDREQELPPTWATLPTLWGRVGCWPVSRPRLSRDAPRQPPRPPRLLPPGGGPWAGRGWRLEARGCRDKTA